MDIREYIHGISKTRLMSILAIGTIAAGMLVHIEILIAARHAPETVLVQIYKTKGLLEGKAACYADIITPASTTKKKPLRALESVYDFLAPRNFFVNIEKGFHVLETGFKNYSGEYEIRIVCYSDNFDGVSYTIISNENQNECDVQDEGKTLVCW